VSSNIRVEPLICYIDSVRALKLVKESIHPLHVYDAVELHHILQEMNQCVDYFVKLNSSNPDYVLKIFAFFAWLLKQNHELDFFFTTY